MVKHLRKYDKNAPQEKEKSTTCGASSCESNPCRLFPKGFWWFALDFIWDILGCLLFFPFWYIMAYLTKGLTKEPIPVLAYCIVFVPLYFFMSLVKNGRTPEPTQPAQEVKYKVEKSDNKKTV